MAKMSGQAEKLGVQEGSDPLWRTISPPTDPLTKIPGLGIPEFGTAQRPYKPRVPSAWWQIMIFFGVSVLLKEKGACSKLGHSSKSFEHRHRTRQDQNKIKMIINTVTIIMLATHIISHHDMTYHYYRIILYTMSEVVGRAYIVFQKHIPCSKIMYDVLRAYTMFQVHVPCSKGILHVPRAHTMFQAHMPCPYSMHIGSIDILQQTLRIYNVMRCMAKHKFAHDNVEGYYRMSSCISSCVLMGADFVGRVPLPLKHWRGHNLCHMAASILHRASSRGHLGDRPLGRTGKDRKGQEIRFRVPFR